MTVPVWEFENAVWELEDIRLVVRANRFEEVEAYDFERAYPGNRTLGSFIDTRIRPLLGDRDFAVIGGRGLLPRGLTHVSRIRQSYG